MSARVLLQRIFKTPLARCAVQFTVWLPAFILFSNNVASIERVSGISMSPNFCPNPTIQDYILASRWNATRNLQRGQVVLYQYVLPPPYRLHPADMPSSPVNPEIIVIKRIVGLPGDVVRTRKNSVHGVVTVPPGHVWVEGDEAFHSLDSNTYGPVPIALITAKVTHIVYPPQRVGAVSQDPGLGRERALVSMAVERDRSAVYGGVI